MTASRFPLLVPPHANVNVLAGRGHCHQPRQRHPLRLTRLICRTWSARLSLRAERDSTRPCVHWVTAHPYSSVPFLVRGEQRRAVLFIKAEEALCWRAADRDQLRAQANWFFSQLIRNEPYTQLWFDCALCKHQTGFRSPAPHAHRSGSDSHPGNTKNDFGTSSVSLNKHPLWRPRRPP